MCCFVLELFLSSFGPCDFYEGLLLYLLLVLQLILIITSSYFVSESSPDFAFRACLVVAIANTFTVSNALHCLVGCSLLLQKL